jgi:hypothetical protein
MEATTVLLPDSVEVAAVLLPDPMEAAKGRGVQAATDRRIASGMFSRGATSDAEVKASEAGGCQRRRRKGIGGRAVDADFTLLIGRAPCWASPTRGGEGGTDARWPSASVGGCHDVEGRRGHRGARRGGEGR